MRIDFWSRIGLTASIVLLGVGLHTDVFAKSVTNWDFFTFFGINEKPTQLSRAFAKDVFKATDGRLKITVYAGGELPFKASDVIRAVATNQVQMGDVAIGFAAGDVPEINVLGLPFLCTSYAQFNKAIPFVGPIVDSTLKNKFHVTTVMHWPMPPQNLWLNRSVSHLEDLKGMKVRAWNPQLVEMMQILGGSAISITSAEVITALERGIIDGAITSALSANDWHAYSVVKTGYMLNIIMAHMAMMVNDGAMEKLPAEVKAILMAKIHEWTPRYTEMSEQSDIEARANLKANKVTLVEPSADDMAKGRALMKPMWNQWAKKYGATGQQLLDSTTKACGAG